MLWINNTNNEVKFHQVFTDFDIVHTSNNNKIYLFHVDLNTNGYNFDLHHINTMELTQKQKEPQLYIFDIKLLDNIISFTNIKTNLQYTFSSKMLFVDPNENSYNLPFFTFTYKKVNKNRMPVLIDNLYDLSTQSKFIIYEINDNLQYIVEIVNNMKKKYFITTDLHLIKKFLNK